jgi:hypothetical protein
MSPNEGLCIAVVPKRIGHGGDVAAFKVLLQMDADRAGDRPAGST